MEEDRNQRRHRRGGARQRRGGARGVRLDYPGYARADGGLDSGCRPAPGASVLKHALHGQFVTKNNNASGGFVTHDIIRGTATAVSPTSITVKAADNATQTYVVNSSTKVRQRSNGKGSASTIGAVNTGDNVLVVGTGTSTMTATGIVDVKK